MDHARTENMEGAVAALDAFVVQANPGIYVPDNSTLGNIQQRRPLQSYQGVVLFKTIGTASYNALSISTQKTVGHGLSLLGGFRWAKNLDESSGYAPSLCCANKIHHKFTSICMMCYKLNAESLMRKAALQFSNISINKNATKGLSFKLL